MSNEVKDPITLLKGIRPVLDDLAARYKNGQQVNYNIVINDILYDINYTLSHYDTNINEQDVNVNTQNETTTELIKRHLHDLALSSVPSSAKLLLGLIQKISDETTWMITYYILYMILIFIIYLVLLRLIRGYWSKALEKAIILSMAPISESILKIILYYISKNNNNYSINLEIEWIEILLIAYSSIFYLICVSIIKYIFYSISVRRGISK